MRDEASATATAAWPASLAAASPARLIVLALIALLGLPMLLTFIYSVWIYPFYVSPLRRLPGPKDNSWLVGQCHKFLKVTWVPQLFLEWSRMWPETPFIRYLGVGNAETLLASNMTSYREVLQTKSSYFIKPTLSRQTANVVIGDGLPFAEGNAHRHRRGVLNKPFSTVRVKAFIPTLQAKAQRLVDVLARNVDRNGEVEAESSIWKSVLDVIGMEVLGLDLNHLESDESPLHRIFSKTMQQSLTGHIIHFFSSYIPLRHLIPININNEFLDSCEAARTFVRSHVSARRAIWEMSEKKGELSEDADALQCMISQGPEAWSDDDIVEYVLNLMVLGHDTTACTLVWAVYVLSRNAEVQQKLRDDINGLLQTCDNPTYADIEQLSYLENFIHEVLRVYCPVAYIPREATADVEVAGVLLPKGTVVNLSPAIMNMHPHIWGEDAATFNPDRWNNLTGDAANAYAFESFHNGPRVCLGKRLSLMEMKTMLMELVSRYQIDTTDADLGQPTEFASPSFTLRPKEKLRVRLTQIA
jgi:cytochrome P450